MADLLEAVEKEQGKGRHTASGLRTWRAGSMSTSREAEVLSAQEE